MRRASSLRYRSGGLVMTTYLESPKIWGIELIATESRKTTGFPTT